MYHYSSTGTGVHVYTVDTVSHCYHQLISNLLGHQAQQNTRRGCTNKTDLCCQYVNLSVVLVMSHACWWPLPAVDMSHKHSWFMFEHADSPCDLHSNAILHASRLCLHPTTPCCCCSMSLHASRQHAAGGQPHKQPCLVRGGGGGGGGGGGSL